MRTITDIGTLVVQTPGTCGGRPRIAGTRISVQNIAIDYNARETPEEIVKERTHLTLAQVYAALAYYFANQQFIDALIAEEQELYDRLVAGESLESVLKDNQTTMQTITDIGTLIVRTPGTCGGRPRIAGMRISVQGIAALYKDGLTPEEIAEEFEFLTLAQVYAALTYYHANKAEIEGYLEADKALYDQLEAEHRSTQTS